MALSHRYYFYVENESQLLFTLPAPCLTRKADER